MPVYDEANDADGNKSPLPVGGPLGRIEIASIGLTAMVEEGTGRKTLQRGVGHIVGTSLLGQSGNAGLAGHRDTFFRKLRNIHEGDEITVTTLAGTISLSRGSHLHRRAAGLGGPPRFRRRFS